MTVAPAPFPGLGRPADKHGITWDTGTLAVANTVLAEHHYLGPIRTGQLITVGRTPSGDVAAVQVWKKPTARHLPSDGTWLELARWCIIADLAGPNAGSRQHAATVRLIKAHHQNVTTLVSYSDPSHGHTGALDRSCNWEWAPTWHRLRPPPTGNGDWGTGAQAVKDRWVYAVRPDMRRLDVLTVRDGAAARLIARLDQPQAGWAAISRYLTRYQETTR